MFRYMYVIYSIGNISCCELERFDIDIMALSRLKVLNANQHIQGAYPLAPI